MGKAKEKVLIALSGGIDSAVSAYLLIKQGYRVKAAFMKNWSSTAGLIKNECPWLSDRREALRVAAFLRIPLHTLDFEKQYQKRVMKYFFNEYKKGRTPNPDVMCNKEIKFGLLYDWARSHKFDYLATGHYAQTSRVVSRQVAFSKKFGYLLSANRYLLKRSVDEFKDQTYFIYNIKKEQLPHLLFPIGGMKKTQVRELARKIKLPNAERKESMGLCFVGKIRLKEFLGQKLKPKKGLIIGQKGEILGQHEGLANYTIGQRQGIKVGASGPYFVFKKDMGANTLYVSNNPNDKRLFVREIQLHSVNWIDSAYKLKAKSYKLVGRYRHQGELVPLTIIKIKKDLYRVVFNKPQKAVASGQSLVLYKGKECMGGGVIV
ncbi:MAG: tRNA 2-thiouridine(34) synthase MnmA, partial [Candidatus Doudnabacteria bacterium]|nr:tRNA 2-thiouridine(34) synthase MnmA [Candidatus Doudnabacteria bacterium]